MSQGMENMVEVGTQQFWLAYKAWKGEEGFSEGWDLQRLMKELNQVRKFASAQNLQSQVEALIDDVIVMKRKRKKKVKSKKSNVVFLEQVRLEKAKAEVAIKAAA